MYKQPADDVFREDRAKQRNRVAQRVMDRYVDGFRSRLDPPLHVHPARDSADVFESNPPFRGNELLPGPPPHRKTVAARAHRRNLVIVGSLLYANVAIVWQNTRPILDICGQGENTIRVRVDGDLVYTAHKRHAGDSRSARSRGFRASAAGRISPSTDITC